MAIWYGPLCASCKTAPAPHQGEGAVGGTAGLGELGVVTPWSFVRPRKSCPSHTTVVCESQDNILVKRPPCQWQCFVVFFLLSLCPIGHFKLEKVS